jgi:peptidoglycan hydrolase-like protein with peptidoglycan-binding domain
MKPSIALVVAFLSVAAALPSYAQPVSQLDVNAIPKIDSDGIRKVQVILRQRGFPAGPFDGVAGPLTKTAVRAFQVKYGMKTSGEIDNQLLLALGAVDLAGAE